MLQELHLRGLGVIAEASVELAPGLNVFTGETGVGKTLLVTSLALLSGGRAHARLVAEGAPEAVIQGVIAPNDEVREDLKGRGIDAGDEVIVVRRLSADGRSRASIDGQLVPASLLAEVGELLLEIHGQGAGFALAHPAAQLAAIDALGRNDEVLSRYREALARLRRLEGELSELDKSEAARAREIDLLTYQTEEIERAGLEAGEDDRLHAAIARLEHAERLGTVGAQVGALVGSEGAAGALAEAHRSLETAVTFDPDVASLVSRLADAAAEVSDVAQEIRAWADAMESDPVHLETLRERKGLLASLERKYGARAEDVLAFAERASERLNQLVGADDRIAMLDGELASARSVVDEIASELSERRARAAQELTEMVGSEFPALALPKARFAVEHEVVDPTDNGADRITFGFSSSATGRMEEIGKVASGGELSRAMIAVTLALAQAHSVGVLVFDEADQGIGGEAALELGRRLQQLGRSHQVLVVSHLPQVAAFADRHIVVRRDDHQVDVAVLESEGRLTELSRMLAGLESSELARAHAAELLALTGRG